MPVSLAPPTRARVQALLLGLLLVLFLTISGCTVLDNWQRQKIYRPTPGDTIGSAGLPAGIERYQIALPPPQPAPTSDAAAQTLALWWLPQERTDAPTLLYLHGTFRNLSENRHKIDALRDAGFAVLAVDYRGWGLSSAIVPSEQTIMQDARLAWEELVRRQPAAVRRVIYGHSMGSGVAVALASQLHYPQDYAGLILESAFTSFPDVARNAGILPRLLFLGSRERFDSLGKIAQVHAPLLMMHGRQDRTIPIQLGLKLFDAAQPPKQWLTIDEGDHSDLDQVAPRQYRGALEDFRMRFLAAP